MREAMTSELCCALPVPFGISSRQPRSVMAGRSRAWCAKSSPNFAITDMAERDSTKAA